jgi:phosphatidylglycerophosphatase A
MKRLLTSCFGLGWLPLAPGSWGSLPPTIIFALICYFGTTSLFKFILMAAIALAGSIICVKLAPSTIALTGKNDPGEVVADEVAGQALTFLVVLFYNLEAFSIRQILGIAAAGFLLFRAFDTIKPWPIHKLEKLPAGWGILADDLMAGVYAGIALLLCLSLYAHRLVE